MREDVKRKAIINNKNNFCGGLYEKMALFFSHRFSRRLGSYI